MWHCPVGFTCPHKLAKGKNPIWTEVLKLHVESLHHLAEESIRRKPESAGEEIPEHHDILLLRRRHCLARRRSLHTTFLEEPNLSHIRYVLRPDG
jgi:hypothetical protein